MIRFSVKTWKPYCLQLLKLAKVVDDNPVDAIITILKEIKSVSDGDLSESRYLNQLPVLVQLRKLENHFD